MHPSRHENRQRQAFPVFGVRSLRSQVISIKSLECLTLEVYAKLRKWGKCVLLATCDVELLGEILREGKIVFKVGEEFYKGPKMPVEEAVELMK